MTLEIAVVKISKINYHFTILVNSFGMAMSQSFFTKSSSMIRVKKQVFGICFDLQQMIELKYRGPM